MKILLVGCGNIGSALLNIWISSHKSHEIVVVQPSLRNRDVFLKAPNVVFVKSMKEVSRILKKI